MVSKAVDRDQASRINEESSKLKQGVCLSSSMFICISYPLLN